MAPEIGENLGQNEAFIAEKRHDGQEEPNNIYVTTISNLVPSVPETFHARFPVAVKARIRDFGLWPTLKHPAARDKNL